MSNGDGGKGKERAEGAEDDSVSVTDVHTSCSEHEDVYSLTNLQHDARCYKRYLENKYKAKLEKRVAEYYAYLRREHQKKNLEPSDEELKIWSACIEAKIEYEKDLYKTYRLKLKKKKRHFVKFLKSRLEPAEDDF